MRNVLAGRIARIEPEGPDTDLVTVDCAGQPVLARLTHAATRDLQLAAGLQIWVLLKAVSVRAAIRE